MRIKVLDRAAMGLDLSFDALCAIGETVIYDGTAPEELNERVKDAEALVLNKIKISAEVMDNAPNLKVICVFATGYDNIDVSAAEARGIAVCNVPAYSTDSVTLFTVATVLSLYAHISEYRSYVASGAYSAGSSANCLTPVYHELRGKVWGIVGFGNIGKSVARVAEAFGAEVIVNKRTPIDGYRCVDIDTLCSLSDIITVHCPLNNETRGLINEKRISMMKSGVLIVNEARGAVLDEEAVASAVISGKIGAFGCDVYSSEPFDKKHPYNLISGLDNVCLTPHSAWGAYEARMRCLSVICDNISSYEKGEMLNRVDKPRQN
ncbi:MAG: hydroxyacid dehydrogenase [Ruminococcaceae bacterium]|nr:hydroxyacid dehydrogenase [Oscillospiraceae bacterium]